MSASSTSPFPSLTIGSIPSTPLTIAALEYSREHTSPSTVNHCLRSTAFALLLARKLPPFQGTNTETLALSTILHDLGWATTRSLISKDKRFEVDGANLARDFVKNGTADSSDWNEHRIQLMWDAIAMHTTPSIAVHKQPEVALTTLGILADFLGPHHPTGAITVDEYKEIVTAFPRLDFREELPKIMCGLCEEKPETTYDNFVGDFGCELVPGYKEEWEKRRISNMMKNGLAKCLEYET